MIREAVPEDVDSLWELWLQLAIRNAGLDERFEPDPEGKQSFADYFLGELDDPDRRFVVAERNGQVAGYCCASVMKRPSVYKRRRYGLLSNLVVDQGHRRAGIGTSLVSAAILWLTEQGVSRIELRVLDASEEAVGFWKSMGFAPYMSTMRSMQ